MLKKSPVVRVVKIVLPAVVSIAASKHLPAAESSLNPLPNFNKERGLSFNKPLTFESEKSFALHPRKKEETEIGGGSGFIVNSSGIILTNRHVVTDPLTEYVITLTDERKFKAKILTEDPINDIAILKIEAKNLPIIKLGDSSTLELGQTVIAIGNALGAFRNTVSVGVVSGLSREIIAGDMFTKKITKLRGLIQTDAAINPGNSGGPLIDIQGKAIGINAAMIFMAENVSFAMPINIAKKGLRDLKKYGRICQPFLGIKYIQINKELQVKHGLSVNHGALIIPNAALENTTMVAENLSNKTRTKGLDVILEIQNIKITEKNPLEDILQRFRVGQIVSLKILRNNKEINIKTTLKERRVNR